MITTLTDTVKEPRKFTKQELQEGVAFVYEPGNGTRFDIIMVLHGIGLLIVLNNFRTAWTFPMYAGYLSDAYVAEKLRQEQYMGDAIEIAKLLNLNIRP